MVSTRDLPESLAEVDLGVIDALKKLKQEADVLRERLGGLESVKADFDPAVFARVSADYSRQLDTIESNAEPLRQQARENYARLRGALTEITNAHEAVKLDRQEIELRRKLGEFDEAAYKEKLQDIEAALADRAKAHKQGESLRGRFLEVFASEEELIRGVSVPAGPASTQEMPMAIEPPPPPPPPQMAPAPPPAPTPAAPREAPVAQTQILQVLKMPEPPRVPPPPGAPATDDKPPAFGPNATMSLRTARLVPQNPEAGRTAIPLPPRPISMGSDPASEIRIGGPGVEARHAQITVDSKGYSLNDLGSKSGTRVNAEAIQQRLLKHEDVIQIGMARFVFREG